jgi:hypothetical protein
MARRKTIEVAALIDKANHFFEHSDRERYAAERKGVATFLDSILHQTGNYAGFMYLEPYGSPGSDPSRVYYSKRKAER